MTMLWGDEITVNINTSGLQLEGSVAALANGEFVATWQNGSEISARVYHANGMPLTFEFTVNATTLGDQADPVVCGLTGGRFVVAWADEQTHSIMGRFFNLDGTQAGGDFTIATYAGGVDMPAIAALTDGGFAVTWQRQFSATDSDIQARVYNAAGVPGDVFNVDTNTVVERTPAIAGLSDGNFVVVWEDAGSAQETDGAASHIRGRIYSSAGIGQGDEFIVNSIVVDAQSEPAVAALSDGRFVVSWTHGASGINAREFSNDGTALAPDFIVTTDGEHSSVTGLADGRYLFAFERWEPAGDSIYGVIGANSQDLDQEPGFVVNAANGFQIRPALATLADGRVVALWNERGNDAGNPSLDAIEAQILDPRESGANVQGAGLPDEFIGTMGSDVLKGAGGHDLLDGGDADDDSRGGEDWLFGGAGDDTLLGGRGPMVNHLVGGPGADDLIGGASEDDPYSLIGNMGLDIAEYGSSSAGVIVNLMSGIGTGGDAAGDTLVEIEAVVGSAFADGLIGDDEYNFLSGGGGSDTLKGGGGSDALRGGEGSDSLVGGDGADWADFAGNYANYAVNLQANGSVQVVDQRPGTPYGTDTLNGVEYLRFADRLLATVAPLADVVWQNDSGGIATANGVILDPAGLDVGALEVAGAGDFDNDGDGDILVRMSDGGILTMHIEDGNMVDVDDLAAVSNAWHVRGVADFDGDGDADVLWRHDEGQAVIWEMQDGDYVTNHNLGVVPTSWQLAGAGDFDGDGDADILWRGNEGQVVTWEIENGDYVTHTSHVAVGNSWQIRGTGDFDGDGDADILWHHEEGEVVAWEMEGGEYVVNHNIASAPNSWQVQGTRDFDSDGDDDLLWRHEDGAVLTWEIQGHAFVQNHNYGMVSNQWQIRGTGEFDLM
jgi:Ca2+-binding RTX toxin-like protein